MAEDKRLEQPLTADGDMIVRVALTRGYVAVVDACDLDKIAGIGWYAKMDMRADGSSVVYASSTRRINGKCVEFKMHRLISGAQSGQIVDHIDGDGLNNRRGNLRLVTISENQYNSAPRRFFNGRETSSMHKGVAWSRAIKKWTAYISSEGKRKHIGVFDSEIDAALAYNNAASILHGKYARLNNVCW